MEAPYAPCPVCLGEGVSVNGTTSYTSPTKRGASLPIELEPSPPTPLERLNRLGADLGIELWMKDETRGATGSHKDRLAAVAARHAAVTDAEVVVVSSSGNHGAAISSACTRIGMHSVCLTFPGISPALRRMIEGVGGTLVAVAQPEERWTLMRQAVAERGWYPASNFHDPPIGSNPFAVDGYTTIAWELAAQLGTPPDWVVCPTCYGDLLFGMFRGLAAVCGAGVWPRVPRLLAACTSDSLAAALRTGADQPQESENRAPEAVSIGLTRSTHQALAALRRSDGTAQTVGTKEILTARRRLSRREGSYQELASAAGLAAVDAARSSGAITAGEHVVLIATSTGLKDPPGTGTETPLLTIAPTVDALLGSVHW